MRPRPPGIPGGDGGEHLGGPHALAAHRQPSLVGAGDQEQVLGEPRQPLRLLGGGAQCLLELRGRARAAQGELELGAQQRERRAQLVARVGEEAPLVLERGVQASEHVVQRRREPRDLVAGGRDGQPCGRRCRDRRGAPAHRLDRAQRRRGQPVAGGRREREADEAAEKEIGEQVGERLLARLEGAGDDDRSGAVGGRYGEQAPASGRPAQLDRPQHPGAVYDAARLRRTDQGGHVRRGADDAAVRVEHLRECRAGRAVAVDEAARLVRARAGLGRLQAERLVDRPEQRAADADIDEGADAGEEERHRERERQGQPQPDWHATHSPARSR